MMKSLEAIKRLLEKDYSILKREKWLLYLALTVEQSINLERIQSLEDMHGGYILSYVERTLYFLSCCHMEAEQAGLIEECLIWSEVSKGGLPQQRRQWEKAGINLFVHNIGSAQIYTREAKEPDAKRRQIITALIATHGLVGQYIRGEVPLEDNKPLQKLVEDKLLSASELREILKCLNYCVISAVDTSIWLSISGEVENVIELILNGRYDCQYTLKERLSRLRSLSIANGEAFDAEADRLLADSRVRSRIAELMERAELWYVEAALYDFSLEEFMKIFLLLFGEVPLENVRHVSFERFMKELYYQHSGSKRVNIYKKRIIEKYLSEISFDSLLKGDILASPHVVHEVTVDEYQRDTAFFTFRFSPAGNKLIDFCVEAEKSDVLYERAIVLLFDLFGLRKDIFDRFYEEEAYLQTMNQTVDYKRVLLDDIVGERVVDIGPGGGALMDLIEERYPGKKVMGVDISQNVLESLKRKKLLENKKWDVVYGDALNLEQYMGQDGVDTIIFCSILHELYSYIEFEGRKFNHSTLKAALQSAWSILPPRGRILIRDGIMTEPESQKRIIRFLSQEGMAFLKRYAADFKGREITFTVVGQNEVMMPVNDAMEFLYTYTWGEESYVHEVNEQFGYFTPTAYREFITSALGQNARILKFQHFLQDGYTVALSQKIEFFDEGRKPVRLPDSTCIVVIEKEK